MTTFATFIPLSPESAPSSIERKVTPRVFANDFGGAYAQRLPAGRDTMLETVKMTFGNLTTAEAQDMLAFFASKRGTTPFLYQLPGEATPRKWIATEWENTPRHVNDVDVTATFEEVNNP